MNRRDYEGWSAAGGRSLGDRANARVCEIVESHEVPRLSPEVVSELDALERSWWQGIDRLSW
jgi:trimethylamine:corrinoid methyltransferase-like protein